MERVRLIVELWVGFCRKFFICDVVKLIGGVFFLFIIISGFFLGINVCVDRDECGGVFGYF